jgi:hypothetical protein
MMRVIDMKVERADTDFHWGVLVDGLVLNPDGTPEKFGGNMLVDKRLPGKPEDHLRSHFDSLRKVWKERTDTVSAAFIDGLELVAKQVISNG